MSMWKHLIQSASKLQDWLWKPQLSGNIFNDYKGGSFFLKAVSFKFTTCNVFFFTNSCQHTHSKRYKYLAHGGNWGVLFYDAEMFQSNRKGINLPPKGVLRCAITTVYFLMTSVPLPNVPNYFSLYYYIIF